MGRERRRRRRASQDRKAGGSDLVRAVADLDGPRIAELLADGALTEERDDRGRTPLMLAALHGEPRLVRALLTAGADPEATTVGDPAQGLGSAVARALAAREGEEHRTALSFGVESGELEVVEMLIESGANPYNTGATTPLDLAVLGGDPEIVRVLLEAGADPNERDSEGDTPLMLAAASGEAETIAALLEMGAIASARNDDGEDALAIGARAGQAAAVEALSPHGSLLARWRARKGLKRARRQGVRTNAALVARLHRDALYGRLGAVRRSLASGVPVDATFSTAEGATALFAAVRGGHLSVIRALLEAGADPNRRSATDVPLTAALGPGVLDPRARVDVIRALVAGGADLETADADGLTPLMRAVIGATGDASAVVALCDLGAALDSEHASGATALDFARQDDAKAHIVTALEAFAKSDLPGKGSSLRVKRAGAMRPDEETPIEALRGIGDSRTSEVVCAVRASIDEVAPAFEALRGGRQWSRDVYGRDGLVVGKEGLLVYQFRGHDWTLVQTELLDSRTPQRSDARRMSERLHCEALHFEVCDASEIVYYALFRDGGAVERLRRTPVPDGDGKVDFASTLYEGEHPASSQAIGFASRRFESFGLYIPGLGDDRISSALREFAPSDFSRVDFLRLEDR